MKYEGLIRDLLNINIRDWLIASWRFVGFILLIYCGWILRVSLKKNPRPDGRGDS
jgi:hypothetical protein